MAARGSQAQHTGKFWHKAAKTPEKINTSRQSHVDKVP